MERMALEQQIFSWENWTDEGPMSMQFMNVELKVPVGDFSVGAKFPFAFILGEASLLVLIDEQNEEHAFNLKVNVGESVAPPQECGPECQHDHTH